MKFRRKLEFSIPVPLSTAALDGSEDTKWTSRIPKTGAVVPEGTPVSVRYRRWWGFVNTDKPDYYNRVVDKMALVEAWPDYMKRGGRVRYMHDPKPVGIIFPGDWELRDDGIYIGVSVPETKPEVIAELDSGLLNGYSLGWDGLKVIWSDDSEDGYTHFVKIKIAESSLVDMGATPNTDIREEGTTGTEDEDLPDTKTILGKIWAFITSKPTGDETRTPKNEKGNGGTPPDDHPNTEDDEMTPEQFNQMLSLMSEKLDGLTARVTGVLEKLKPQQTATTTQQPPNPEDQKPNPEMDELKSKIQALGDQILTLQRATNTVEPLGQSIQTLETQVVEFEKQVKAMVDSRTPTPDEQLSFIAKKGGGRLTASDLGGK